MQRETVVHLRNFQFVGGNACLQKGCSKIIRHHFLVLHTIQKRLQVDLLLRGYHSFGLLACPSVVATLRLLKFGLEFGLQWCGKSKFISFEQSCFAFLWEFQCVVSQYSSPCGKLVVHKRYTTWCPLKPSSRQEIVVLFSGLSLLHHGSVSSPFSCLCPYL